MNRRIIKNSLSNLREKVWGWFLLVLTTVAFLLAVAMWLHDEMVKSLFFSAIGSGCLWLGLFYVYVSKSRILVSASGEDLKLPTFSERLRKLALVGMIGVPVLAVISIWTWQYNWQENSEYLTVLVADFDGPDRKSYRVTEVVIKQLREVTREYEDVQIAVLGETITEKQGSKAARDIGKVHKASIVLWGWYAATQQKALVSVHFEMLKAPSSLSLLQDERTLIGEKTALESFEIHVKLTDEISYVTLLTIGLARYEAKDYDGAINSFTKALRFSSSLEQMIDPATVYFYRGNAYRQKGDITSANLDYASAYGSRGISSSEKGRIESAIADFNAAIRLKPDFVDAYNNRGKANYAIAKFAHAIEDFSIAITLEPNLTDAYLNRGLAFLAKGDTSLAIRDYSRAIELKHNDSEIYYNRGLVYKFKGISDNALADFAKVIEFQGGNRNPVVLAGAYYNRGLLYEDRGNFDQAIADFDSVIFLKPADPSVYIKRGIAFNKKADLQRALQDFNRAIELKPDEAEAYYNRGVIYQKRGEFQKAIIDFEHAVRFRTDYQDALLARADVYRHLGIEKNAGSDSLIIENP